MRSRCLALAIASMTLTAGAAFAQNDWTLWDPQPYGGARPATTDGAPLPAPSHPPASKQREPPFGAPGEMLVTGGTRASLGWQEWSTSQASAFGASFSPGLDYFVARNVSIGIDANGSYYDQKGYGADGSLVEATITTLSAGPRFGVDLPLGERVSLYPRLAIGFEWVGRDERPVNGSTSSIAGSPLGYASTTQSGPWASLYVPLLWHPQPHVFLGFGPSVFHDFGSVQGGPDVGGQRTSVGASFVVGAWWGGEREQPARTPAGPATRQSRFGDAGEVVVTGAFDVSARWTTYAGSAPSQTVLSLAPAIDYFVADHLSLGLGVTVEDTSVTGIDPTTGQRVDTEVSGAGLLPRIGFEVPLGPQASWYPWVGCVAGVDSFDEKSGNAENKYSETYVSAVAYAPVLAHVASHAFVGFGPSLRRDLDRTVTAPYALATQNLETSYGASLVVGGWL